MLAQGRDRRREESEQLIQLSNHNQKLVEQLAEVTNQKSWKSIGASGGLKIELSWWMYNVFAYPHIKPSSVVNKWLRTHGRN